VAGASLASVSFGGAEVQCVGLGLVWISDLIREVGVGDGVMLKVVVRLWEGGFWGLACAEEWRIGNST
jgi:preprotein translocase subunit SecY